MDVQVILLSQEKKMADIVNHKVLFNCICCGKTFHRPAEVADYLGKIVMPKGWGYVRILSNFTEYCDSPECQIVLDKCTVGYQEEPNGLRKTAYSF
jgi:hypothetical protein